MREQGLVALIHIQQRKHGVEGWPKHGVYAQGEVDQDHRMVTYQVNAEQGGQLNRNLLPG